MTLLLFIHVVLAAIISTLGDIHIKFIKYPEPVTAPVGDNVTFVCKVNVPGERLAWRWRPADSPDDSWTDVTGSTDKENISTRLDVEVKPDTVSTFYQCVAWYAAITLASVPAQLTVAKLNIKGGHRKRVVTAPPYNSIALHCKEPHSEPPAVIQWWKETKSSRNQVESQNGVLWIRNATISDSGTYICTARNELTREEEQVSEKTVLRIDREDGRTRFIEKDEDVGIIEKGVLTLPVKVNSTLQLWCGLVSFPPPRVTWSREKKALNHRHDYALTIPSFTVEDEDVYTCSANNVRRSWKVVALQQPRWEGTAANVNATEGGSARVICGTLRGYPPPKVHWLLNAEKLAIGKTIHANDTTLYIERVEKRHAGIVQCMACNSLGCAYNAAVLSVVPVEISNQEYTAQTTKSTHTSQSSKKHKKRKQLVPPSRPNVTRFSDDSVMLSWSHANKGLPVEFFKIQYRVVNNNSTDKVEWQTDSTRIQPLTHSHQIDGLVPNTYYKFRVAAVYSNKDNKQGPSSPTFFLKKGGFQAPAAPVLTSVKPLSPTSVQLHWTWSSDDGGVVPEGFYVYYRTVSTAGSYEKLMVSGGSAARSAIVSHLLPGTKYEFKMLSYTAQAPSNFSTIKEAKTLRAPVTEEAASVIPPERGVGAGAGGGGEWRGGRALVTAGGALGAAALLAALATALLLCRRARRHPADKEKGSVPESGGTNGYLPAKVPITITANPMHAEGGDGVEMSFLHNNNTGNEDTLPHPRKNGPATRQYV